MELWKKKFIIIGAGQLFSDELSLALSDDKIANPD